MHNRVDVEVKRQPPPTVFGSKMQAYWSLIKSRQTFLLVLTGWAGFGTAICPITNWRTALLLVGSLFFAVSGATVLNMAIDYDIDAKMERTKGRALPSGVLNLKEVIIFGSLLSLLGIGWSLLLDPFYGLVVSAGLLINVVVYSLALKRRTHFSIVFGGVARDNWPIESVFTMGSKITHTSEIPCPNPKRIGWLIAHLSGFIKMSLNKKRKVSSKIPALKAINTPMSSGFIRYVIVKSGFWFNLSNSGKRNNGCAIMKQRTPRIKYMMFFFRTASSPTVIL